MSGKKGVYLAVVLIVITALYGLFQARTLLSGPQLSVTAPLDGALITTPLYTVRGSASNVSRVQINGRTIAIDPEGRFEDVHVTPEGYHVLYIHAENRLGRSTSHKIQVVGAPPGPQATSTEITNT